MPDLKPLSTNEFTVKNAHFARGIVDQKPDFFTGSLDVDSLFTSTPLQETIEIFTNELFKESLLEHFINKSMTFGCGFLGWVWFNEFYIIFSCEERFGHFFTFRINDPFCNNGEVIQYFGTFSRFYYLVSKTFNFLQF